MAAPYPSTDTKLNMESNDSTSGWATRAVISRPMPKINTLKQAYALALSKGNAAVELGTNLPGHRKTHIAKIAMNANSEIPDTEANVVHGFVPGIGCPNRD